MSLFVLITGTFFLYFLANKEEIAADLLLGINENINGEVRFTDIYLDPFAQFPYVSLALENFNLYEKKENERTILEDPVAEFEDAFIALDIFDLFGERIEITKVLFINGYLDIIKYKNSVHNFEIALGKKKSKQVKKVATVKRKKKTETDSTKTVKKAKKKKSFISKTLKLDLNRISFKNVHLEHNSRRDGSQYNLFVYNMISSLSIMPDTIKSDFYINTEIKDLPVLKKAGFENLVVQLNSRLNYCRNDSMLLIEPSKMILTKAEFRLNGKLSFKEGGFIDLSIEGADKRLGFLNLLLSESGLENLKTGNFFFNGSLKGNFNDEIPKFSVNYGIKDLSMRIPGENDSIKRLKLVGSFVSGKKQDLSDAILKIDTLKATLPGGFLDASFQIENFSAPSIDYQLFLEANIKGFENLIRQSFIDSLQGLVNLKSEFKGSLGVELSSMKVKKSSLRLDLDSVSLKIPGTFAVRNLSGLISGDYNKLKLKNIKLNSGNSDLIVNGSFNRLSSLIVDNKKRIFTNLIIKSNLLDISDFLADGLTLSHNFDYKIRDIDFSLSASAKRTDLFEFKQVPKITLDIHKLSSKVDSILKPINIKRGRLSLEDYKKGYLINLNNLAVSATKGKVLANINYKKENSGKARLKIKANLKQIRLDGLLDNVLIDSTMDFYASPFTAQLDCSFFIDDSKFKQFRLQLSKSSYKWANSKVQLNDLAIKSKAFYFKSDSLSNLVGKFNLKIGKIKTRHYNLEDVVYSIAAKNRKFTIVPQNDSILGVKAEGKLIASPYESPPAYSLDYSLKQFSVGQMFVNFLEDSVLSGKADFYVKLNFKGHDKKNILQTLDGRIRMRANNLTLYGANLDKFINSYRTSQTLNLLDIGVSIYAGPIGLLATKGGGFARVKVTDRRKKSSIDRMISDWKIIGDSLIVDDVAMRTKQNRLALKGYYCYNSDSLAFKIGLLDAKGCSVLKQGFSGPSMKPEMNNFGLFNGMQAQKKAKKECEVFYKGKLVHPSEK